MISEKVEKCTNQKSISTEKIEIPAQKKKSYQKKSKAPAPAIKGKKIKKASPALAKSPLTGEFGGIQCEDCQDAIPTKMPTEKKQKGIIQNFQKF